MNPLDLVKKGLGIIGVVAKLVGLKPIEHPPALRGEKHSYPDLLAPENRALTFTQAHSCKRCGKFNDRRAAFTDPPCKGSLEKVLVELP